MSLKNSILVLSLCFTFFAVQAQECSGFFPFEPDTKFEMTYYNKKDNITSVATHTVNDLTTMDDITAAELSYKIMDDDGELLTEGEYEVECSEAGYRIDMTAILDQKLMKAAHNMEAEISGDALEFPTALEVGTDLPDAETEIKVSSNGIKIMTMRMTIFNRKVEAQEEVTTPAGTFECYKISYNFEVKALLKKKYKVVQWIAKDIGIVRGETYNKKGKLQSYEQLTKLEKL